MAAAKSHASGTGLLTLPEVFEADADEAVRADRHCRSLFPGGGADVAVHVDPPLVRTNATPPYAHHPRRSIPRCSTKERHPPHWRASAATVPRVTEPGDQAIEPRAGDGHQVISVTRWRILAAREAVVGSSAATASSRRPMRLRRSTSGEASPTRASARARSSAASVSRPRRWALMAAIAFAKLLSVIVQAVPRADGLSRS